MKQFVLILILSASAFSQWTLSPGATSPAPGSWIATTTGAGTVGPPPPPPPPPSGPEPWGSILPPERAIDWRYGVGIPGGIPYRTVICATVSPSGVNQLWAANMQYNVGNMVTNRAGDLQTVTQAGISGATEPTWGATATTDGTVQWATNSLSGSDTANIRTAIDNCPANQVVQLTAGTFFVGGVSFSKGNTSNPVSINNVTLRGAGPDQTTLNFFATNSRVCTNSPICLYGPNATVYPGYTGAVARYTGTHVWTGGYARGSTVLTLDSTSGINPGQIVIIDQRSDDIGTLGKPYGLTVNGCSTLPCTVTVTTSIPHQFQVGDRIGIGNGPMNKYPQPAQLSWRGWYTVTAVPSPTTLQYQLTSYVSPETGPLADDGDASVTKDDGGWIFSGNNTLTLNEGMNQGRMCWDGTRDSINVAPVGTCQPSERSTRPQAEVKVVTAVNAVNNQITIDPPVHASNYRASQAPGIFWLTPTNVLANPPTGGYNIRDGIEDLTINIGQGQPSTSTRGIYMKVCYQCWIKNIRSIFSNQNHVNIVDGNLQDEIVDNYFVDQRGGLPGLSQSQSYAISTSGLVSDTLVENNMCQRNISCLMNGGEEGSVWAYNYLIDDASSSTNLLWPMNTGNHDVNFLNLYEGNNAPRSVQDTTHGNGGMYVYFRNRYRGQSLPLKTSNLFTVVSPSWIRGISYIGNVYGTAGVQTNYQAGPTTTDSYVWIFNGSQYTANLSWTGTDPFLMVSLLRWGNYDTATGATRWCGNPTQSAGWSNACVGVVSATYTSGGNISNGTAGQRCNIAFTGGGGVNAGGNVTLTGTQTIAPGTLINILYNGWNYTAGPGQTASVTLSNGGTGQASCSGTATVTFDAEGIAEWPSVSMPRLPATQPPTSITLPPSFYLTGQPLWWQTPWGTPPWPAIGPDVTGSTSYDTAGGHSYKIPAQLCWENLPLDPAYQESRPIVSANWISGSLAQTRIYLNDISNLRSGETITVTGATPNTWNSTYSIHCWTGSATQCPNDGTGTYVGFTLTVNPGTYQGSGVINMPGYRLFNARTCYPNDFPATARAKAK